MNFVVSKHNPHSGNTCRKLIEGDEVVAILVQSLYELNHICLERGEILLAGFYFVEDSNVISFRVHFFIVHHVLFCVLVRLQNLESPTSQIDRFPNQHVFFTVVLSSRWILMSLSF